MERLKVSIFLIILISLPALSKTEIRLKKEVELERDTVYLSDIADIKSDNRKFEEFLSGIKIHKLKKRKEKISRDFIKNVLKNNYIDLSRIVFTGADNTLLRKKIHRITQRSVEDEIRSFIKSRYRDLKIVSINIPKFSIETDGKLEREIREINSTGSYIYLSYRVFKDGVELKKLRISVKYRKLRRVIAAKRYIKKGEIITEEDIRFIKTDKNVRKPFTDIKDIVGSTAKIDISENDVITERMVIPDYKVKRKDYVKVIYSRNSIRIEIQGVALENGKLGDLIKVKNISSGKVLICKVIGKDTVLYTGGQQP
ncbi:MULTISPECIES: flagellar basal body P-ring formation chaperone FlgA [Persephonella]|uniref:Putative flagellar protein FlgA n=1 Tax=Persephonella marina (strain DSM 14350 / EX-H1) TaxID=123214 RepID=C0QPC2_PERMH|nr:MULTISPECIES: flagellar basal body P-ring formation chaperone FlgA [Persephonella]ACO03739.1 putative flagellar protein FlgA [Persephonella marina EX-H1]